MLIKNARPVFFLLFALLINSVVNAQSIKDVLLKGIDSIPMPAEPHGVALFYTANERPEIIATVGFDLGAKMRGTAIIASTLGKGKLLALGSPMYFGEDMLRDKTVAQFWDNTLQWINQGKKSIRVAINKEMDSPALQAFLRARKAQPYTVSNLDLKKKTDVWILAADLADTINQQKLERFISNGGTLIYFSPYPETFKNRNSNQINESDGLQIAPLLSKAGIYNPNIYVKRSDDGTSLRTDSIPDYLHINTMLPHLLVNEYASQLSYVISNYFTYPTLEVAVKYNSPGSTVMMNLKKYFGITDTLPIASPEKPWIINTPQSKVAAKLAYKILVNNYNFNSLEAKAPGYKVFPGDVAASAQRVEQSLIIPVKVGRQLSYEPPSVFHRPHSTGLYVPAGEKVIVTLSPDIVSQHLKVQIGAHRDELFNLDQMTRIGLDLTRTFNLDKTTNTIFSPYGGLLYINIADTCKLETINVKVQGAIKAPYFKLGETSEAEWNATVRNNPAPWAELATDNIILTVPSYRIRNLSNPVKLMQLWDEVLDADADLAIISHKRVHPERIIVDSDVGVPGAYMFCAPDHIIVPDDGSCATMLDEALLRTKGSWGHFHELGHRHQFSGIDFPGTGEVTVNLYTMYVYDKVLHKGLYNHDDIPNHAALLKKIKGYLDNPTYEKWSEDPFLALSMYTQIIEAFGWDAIKAVHTIYRSIPKDQYPQTDQQKRDLWFKAICQVANSNMTRFFDVWKIPVSDAAKERVKNYKIWFPKELE